MADLEGNKTGGRAAGTINKKNQEIQDLAKELGCNPAKILMLIAMGKTEELDCTESFIDLDKRKEAAKELMPYLYGKRKPVDSNGDDKSDVLTDILSAIDANR
jgi:hypothetical protein